MPGFPVPAYDSGVYPYSTLTDMYVNGSTGSDTTGDGTAGAPWATLQKALLAVQGQRKRAVWTSVTINLVAAGTYTFPVLGNDTFGVTITAPSSTWTNTLATKVQACAASVGVAGGVTVQVQAAPGWTPGSSLRGYMVTRTSGNGGTRPIEQATAADTFRVGGNANTGTAQPTVPTDTSAWVNGDDVTVYTPGVIVSFAGYSPAGSRWTNVTFSGVQVGIAGESVSTQPGFGVTLTNCVVGAALQPRGAGQVNATSCNIAHTGAVSIRNGSTYYASGCVFGAGGGAVDVKLGGLFMLNHNNVFFNGANVSITPGGRLMAPENFSPSRTAVMFDGTTGVKSYVGATANAMVGMTLGGGIVYFGKLSSGTYYLTLAGGTLQLSGADAVFQADGVTAASISIDGGTSAAVADASTGAMIYGSATLGSEYLASLADLTKGVPRTRKVVSTPSTLSNLAAATETAFAGPVTIAAGALGAVGRSIRFKAIFTINSVNGADTLRLRARLGATGVAGVVVADTTALTMAANKSVYFEGTIAILSTGAGGTFTSYCDDKVESPATALGTFDAPTSAIDTTVARDLTLTAEWSAQSASDSVTMQWFEVETWPS